MMAGCVLPIGSAPQLRAFRPSSSRNISNCSEGVPSHPYPHLRRIINSNFSFVGPSSGLSSLHHRLKPIPALGSEAEGVPPEYPIHHDQKRDVMFQSDGRKSFEQWDSLTAKFAGAANIPFLVLQLPQILLNARNLLAGNKNALLAVPWLERNAMQGMFTGLLGNLSLLSYFAKKRETEAVVVQTLGVISIYVVISQLAMAEAMPLPQFIVTSIVVASGLVLNFMNYFDLLSAGIWCFWEDFITVAGLSVLPQVMWSTFVPYIPDSILPGAVAFVIAVVGVVMARIGKLSEKGMKFFGAISGWTATFLFMWMPVAQAVIDFFSICFLDVACYDWKWANDPTCSLYPGFHVLHYILRNRNVMAFNKKSKTPALFAGVYCKSTAQTSLAPPPRDKPRCLEGSARDIYKVNFNGSVRNKQKIAGVGMVVRNYKEEVIASMTEQIPFTLDVDSEWLLSMGFSLPRSWVY
ncbi:hypothetical protein RHMOL_Rhmol09G0276600 [Rhododendron molle]|uniref:Uncharacterized protein n=1 Tax=Rhododendron molle TaxID=49168 RepID=A0ACC0MHT4_RHOML|nr:hypothetical protein RHMOL_Rhmol09G0276600 [Rhododendron molle]